MTIATIHRTPTSPTTGTYTVTIGDEIVATGKTHGTSYGDKQYQTRCVTTGKTAVGPAASRATDVEASAIGRAREASTSRIEAHS